MENDIINNAPSIFPHKSTFEQCSHITDYPRTSLVRGLYNSGDVDLVDQVITKWLPLSRWLSEGCCLRDIWIGLLGLADRLKAQATGTHTDDIQRFECLIDFLHYISKQCKIKPFHLQLLKTQLKAPNISLRSISIPQFINYENIEQISVNIDSMDFINRKKKKDWNIIKQEVENCFTENRSFQNSNKLVTSTEAAGINNLLISWQNNKKLRSFLKTLKNLFYSIQIEQFDIKVSYISQQFQCESFQDHYQIRLNPSNKSIDPDFLSKAESKFHQCYQGHFIKSLHTSRSIIRQQVDEFPEDIFSSINDQNNALSEIGHYFKNQLAKSWQKFRLDKPIEQKDPTIEELIELLKSFNKESIESWKLLEESLTTSNKQLFQSGLISRITPTILIPLLQQNIDILILNNEQRTLLGGILVNWTLQQQLERTLHFANHNKWDEFKKEISTIPHSNWKPSDYISWLILELEMNITIREIQIDVAQHMMQINNSNSKSFVMQMNMGEGKTSVILPMLTLNLSSSNSSLVRIIVLKSLFPTNYQSLRYKLGGLLNRRVFPFSCRRDMNFNNEQTQLIFHRFQQGLHNCDVILTSPEDILSFDLLTLDKCRREEYDISRSILIMQRWLKQYIRDVLDESDEILHVKYQLIYTIGGQQQVDGGAERWKTIQSILLLVKNHAEDIARNFNEDVCYKSSERKSSFPQFRLQSQKPFLFLCKKLVNDWLNNRSYRESEKENIREFILQSDLCVDEYLKDYSSLDIQLFLIIRGLLSSEVLFVALKKRYRVNYGINPNPNFHPLLAVPYRAKDVAADRTEFGHPDVALVLTHLTYYYSGLNHLQLTQCFDRLNDHENDPASIYDQWITFDDTDNIPISIQQWKGVNLKDYQQRTQFLFPILQYNILVINYFLNYFVFPREAKQFPYKFVSSAWDLSSSLRSNIITGFSGTNDTQLLLPIHIHQNDLPELEKTDAIVVNNLLKVENENYQSLTINASTDEILNQIINYKLPINVILDVGALFIDGSNEVIAMKWLNLSDKNHIDYVVYFKSDVIFVSDRSNHQHRFEISPASERLDRCIFYLDDVHTRGTDFKFPKGFRAAVTLGNGLTKDRFVQACMRMRKLGHGHSLTFWSSYEVDQQIQILKKHSSVNNTVDLIDILCWVYENTQLSTWDGLHHWASQSLSFQKKFLAFKSIDWKDNEQVFTNKIMKDLAENCLEPEIIELKRMYGCPKELMTVFEMYHMRYTLLSDALTREIQHAVLKQLKTYGGKKRRLAQLLDEEQQRELEEERQLQRPPSVQPCQPILHEEIKKLSQLNEIIDIESSPLVFRHVDYAFTSTTLFKNCQPNSWSSNLWISTEFQRVIETKGESLNPFLRPPRWIIVYQNQNLILLSPFEANWLMGQLKFNESSITTLRLLLPRTKRIQSIFVNTPTLTIPPLIGFPNNNFLISNDWLIQLFIFNGTLYFENIDEQNAFCQCLSLCPKPRTQEEEEAFEKGWISSDSFVRNREHRFSLRLDQARFHSNPLDFIKEIIENRNNSHATITSHVGSIILKSLKLI
ncbi:hypothetical protein I4U23_022231 [Adineta vaga]|nr:hypothetical protein I4U23_022231 [Adineta vaga]